MACHSLEANRVGPMLDGVVGRKVASVANYDYSDALRRVKGKWDARRLDAWLRDPQAVAPGAKMGFALDDPQARRQVIMFLTLTGAPSRPKPR
jgi:cytochrome c